LSISGDVLLNVQCCPLGAGAATDQTDRRRGVRWADSPYRTLHTVNMSSA
jgi:hypothetical protein